MSGYIIKTTDMTEEQYEQKKREWLKEYQALCDKRREYTKLRKQYKKLQIKIPFAEWRKITTSSVSLAV